MSVDVRGRLADDLMKAVRGITKRQVFVGIPAENADRQAEKGEEGAPLNNAAIGYIMETGLPERNIPARPFLTPGIADAQERLVGQLRKGAVAALAGDEGGADRALHATGLIGQSAVQKRITDGPFIPLSKRTLQRRKARGRTGEKPLLDTGQLRRAVNYVIREKGKS